MSRKTFKWRCDSTYEKKKLDNSQNVRCSATKLFNNLTVIVNYRIQFSNEVGQAEFHDEVFANAVAREKAFPATADT